jgi:hypothetical protein
VPLISSCPLYTGCNYIYYSLLGKTRLAFIYSDLLYRQAWLYMYIPYVRLRWPGSDLHTPLSHLTCLLLLSDDVQINPGTGGTSNIANKYEIVSQICNLYLLKFNFVFSSYHILSTCSCSKSNLLVKFTQLLWYVIIPPPLESLFFLLGVSKPSIIISLSNTWLSRWVSVKNTISNSSIISAI